MVFLSPLEAAKLAGEVYSVNQEDKFALDSFLSGSIFASGSAKAMNARVGFRAINTTDGFGVCAPGPGVYANHVILVFRGAPKVNFSGLMPSLMHLICT